MLQVVSNELAELLRGEIDTLEAVGFEELPGLGKLQCLRNVGMDLREKLGGIFAGPHRPNQTDVLKPDTVSATVGRSGSPGTLFSVAAAISLTFPVRHVARRWTG